MAAAAAEDAAPTVVFKFLTLSVYSDGSISRAPYDPPPLPASPSFDDDHAGVATKDITLHHTLSARLFLPPPSPSALLPTLLYFHGGGFCSGSTTLPPDHRFLCKLAAHARILIVSIDYRLAPEHRLPAAYDDCFDALLWLHQQAAMQACGPAAAAGEAEEPWLAAHADFSKCFLAGDSAGANIVHHVATKAANHSWEHLRLEGMILIHPFFSTQAPSGSELRNPVMREFIEQLLKTFLPIGASRDHPFMNPLAAEAEDVALPRVLVAVASEDLLKEAGMEYYQALEKTGKQVKLFISEHEEHVFHLHTPDSDSVQSLLKVIGDFLNSRT